MKSLVLPSFAAGVALLLCSVGRAADDNTSTIKFSDPGKPGTLKIVASRGNIRVQGADTQEVAVRSDMKPTTTQRKDGLRVLGTSSSFALGEKNNVVTLDASSDGMFHGSSDYNVTVPRGTNVQIQNWWGGNVTCIGINGDLEVNSMHGEIRLQDVGGGVVASTMNGSIDASVRELRDGRALSFTSMNGPVTIHVPADAKASVRLRTQNGSILTDFDETALVTKSENLGGKMGFKGRSFMTPEVQVALREATQASVVAVHEAMDAVKEGLDAAREQVDDARREADQEKRQAQREADQAKRDAQRAADRARREAARDSDSGVERPAPPAPAAVPATPGAPKPASAPKPPKLPIPPITGGNLVSGTLNGGGPEISVATMNGEVKLLKATAQK